MRNTVVSSLFPLVFIVYFCLLTPAWCSDTPAVSGISVPDSLTDYIVPSWSKANVAGKIEALNEHMANSYFTMLSCAFNVKNITFHSAKNEPIKALPNRDYFLIDVKNWKRKLLIATKDAKYPPMFCEANVNNAQVEVVNCFQLPIPRSTQIGVLSMARLIAPDLFTSKSLESVFDDEDEQAEFSVALKNFISIMKFFSLAPALAKANLNSPPPENSSLNAPDLFSSKSLESTSEDEDEQAQMLFALKNYFNIAKLVALSAEPDDAGRTPENSSLNAPDLFSSKSLESDLDDKDEQAEFLIALKNFFSIVKLINLSVELANANLTSPPPPENSSSVSSVITPSETLEYVEPINPSLQRGSATHGSPVFDDVILMDSESYSDQSSSDDADVDIAASLVQSFPDLVETAVQITPIATLNVVGEQEVEVPPSRHISSLNVKPSFSVPFFAAIH